jgi:hypothetical protein
MEHIQKTFEIDCPVHRVYNQWTQFEQFPRDAVGIVSHRLENAIERVKGLIEQRGQETGAGRGEVRGGEEVQPSDAPKTSGSA